MGTVVLAKCIAALEQIQALACQEGVLIDHDKVDEIWPLREHRKVLTELVSACCCGMAADGELSGSQATRVSLLVRSIGESDHENWERLAALKAHAASQLGHLYEGKQAVHGYRVEFGQAPVYVDRHG